MLEGGAGLVVVLLGHAQERGAPGGELVDDEVQEPGADEGAEIALLHQLPRSGEPLAALHLLRLQPAALDHDRNGLQRLVPHGGTQPAESRRLRSGAGRRAARRRALRALRCDVEEGRPRLLAVLRRNSLPVAQQDFAQRCDGVEGDGRLGGGTWAAQASNGGA